MALNDILRIWIMIFVAVILICAKSLLGLQGDLYLQAQDHQRQDKEYFWQPGDSAHLNMVIVHGMRGILFEAGKKSFIDITPNYTWHDIKGPLTLRMVFQPTRMPGKKTPLISKWKMVEGGRSFELGVMPGGRIFFDVSASGNWDKRARELVSWCRVSPGRAYSVAAVFDPGVCMELFINGHACGAIRLGVPKSIWRGGKSRVLLGAQPPGQRWLDAAIAFLKVDRSVVAGESIAAWSKSLELTELSDWIDVVIKKQCLDLSSVRREVLTYCQKLQVKGKPFGVFRNRDLPGAPVTLYATCDVAWIRACMGEDLTRSLSVAKRRQWIGHINSFAFPDGTYHGGRHSLEHANGMVIGALSLLGGRQKYSVSLYSKFDALEEIQPWLEAIHWERQWSASHLFWGGMFCYSMSRHCSDAWLKRVFKWLDKNLEPGTGWWRKGVPQAGLAIEVLGGAAHIWPVYQHHKHRFPYPGRVIDSILSMQRSDGSWLGFSNYMELDALYGLAYMSSLVPSYRTKDIAESAFRQGQLVQERIRGFLAGRPGAHVLLSVVSTLALLQQLDPDHFHDDVNWSDIFSDRRFYRTDKVECDG